MATNSGPNESVGWRYRVDGCSRIGIDDLKKVAVGFGWYQLQL